MRFHVLGTLELHDDAGQRMQATLAQPKQCALLAYLAVREPGATVRRDTLYGIFWPELSQDHARHALSQALYGLRRGLGADVVQPGRGGIVGLSPSKLWCDAAALHDALAAGRDAEALDLYRGDLLPGFFLTGDRSFESWLTHERERLRRRAGGAVSRLTEAAEREGRMELAVAWASRGVELLPDDEVVLRRLLTLLSRIGDRAAATRAYEAFAGRLSMDFELRPSSITDDLIASIRSTSWAKLAPTAPTAPRVGRTVDRPGVTALPPVTRRRMPRSVGAALAAVAMIVSTVLLVRRSLDYAWARRGSSPVSQVARGSGQSGGQLPRAAATQAAMLSRLGRFYSTRRTPASLAAAIHEYQIAIVTDSGYSPAYSGLADAYVLLSWYGGANSEVVGRGARKAALRALALDPRLAEAHASLGAVFAWIDGNSLLAEREFRRAIELDPGYAPAHDWYALQLAGQGRTDSALVEAAVAHDIDPTSLAIGSDLATMLLWAGREHAAIVQWRNTLALDSSFERAHQQLWHAYALAGQRDDAVIELDQLMRLQGAPARARATLRRAYAKSGWHGVLEWRLRAVSDAAHGAAERPVEAASLCVLLGRREEALAWLRRAHDAQDQYLRFARLDPAFASLRRDPRFLALLPHDAGSL